VRWPQPGSQRDNEPELGVKRGSACSQLSITVAEAEDSSGTQRKGNICQWKMLPSRAVKIVTENTTLCVIVICKVLKRITY
jgi:hypothetical protein